MSSATSTVSRSVAVPRIFWARRRVSGSSQNSFLTLPSRLGRRSALRMGLFIRTRILCHPYDRQLPQAPRWHRDAGAGRVGPRRSAHVDARRDAEGAGLVDQVADAGARSTLLVQGEPGLLVEEVVDEQGDIPFAVQE